MFIKKCPTTREKTHVIFSPWDRTPARVTAAELVTILTQGNRSVEVHEFGVLVKDHDQKVEWLLMTFSPDSKYYGQYDVGYW